MSYREWLFNNLSIQIPSNKPLSVDSAGLAIEDEKKKMAFLFENMTIRDNIQDQKGRILVANVPRKISDKVNKLIANKKRYEFIAHKFINPIKWYHIGFIHELEGEQNFNTYLGNGQSIYKKTTIVPKGRGPFKSFEAGAIDAITLKRLDEILDWSIGNTLHILEGYNGYGYSRFHNTNSPYIFSGTDAYVSGYYIADHVFSQKTVSQQIGIAPLMKVLFERENIKYE